MDFGYLINVGEHQSTSDAKVYNTAAFTRAILPDFIPVVITGEIV